jgi:uncharacterized membrane protein YtjA (UPF0391 family)
LFFALYAEALRPPAGLGTIRLAPRFFMHAWRKCREANNSGWGFAMLGWALTFLVVALLAAVLGFGGIAGVAIEAAKIVFFVALVLFAISAVVGLVRGRTPTVL